MAYVIDYTDEAIADLSAAPLRPECKPAPT
jgi:hypothetical protein